MPYRTFAEYVRQRDESLWLPNQPVVAMMGTMNPFPATRTRLNRTTVTKPVKAPTTPKLIPSPTKQYIKSINRAFE